MLSFDEWNIWYHSSEKDKLQPDWVYPKAILEDVYNMGDALLAGALLITLLNNADRVKIACIAQTVNVIAPIMTAKGGPAWRQTIFWPFYFTSNNGRGTALRQAVSSPSYDVKDRQGVPLLASAAAYDKESGAIAIFAVNRSLDRELDLAVELQGFGNMKVAEWQLLGHKDLKAENTMENPDNVSPENSTGAKLKNNLLSAGLPAASWNMIKLKVK
jgi:alpha-N-arabinofuranosidase